MLKSTTEQERIMLAFHFDFNTAHFQADYIMRRLETLRSLGYDTVIWEMEDAVRFDCAPALAAADAFTREEWRRIIQHAAELGLRQMPLVPCVGHAEYVLKHAEYRHLSETDSGYSYCLSNPDVPEFQKRLLLEIREMFPDSEYFHVGCDEPRMLGTCPRCAAFPGGIHRLMTKHIRTLHDFLKGLGVKTAIWADLITSHPEALVELPKDILLFDWHYDIHRKCGFAYLPGEGNCGKVTSADELSDSGRKAFADSIHPAGGTSCIDPFCFARHLASRGFQVMTCPSSSCSGENDFCGNVHLRVRNIFDSAAAGTQIAGTAVTSWTQHLFPYELQGPSIAAATAAFAGNFECAEDFLAAYGKEHFGSVKAGTLFAAALAELSADCPFTSTQGMGHSKYWKTPLDNHYLAAVDRMVPEELDREIRNASAALSGYYRAERVLTEIQESCPAQGEAELKLWILAARNLQLRARFALLLLYRRGYHELVFTDKIHDDLLEMRGKMEAMYQDKLTGDCMQRFLYILFNLPLKTLQTLEQTIPLLP